LDSGGVPTKMEMGTSMGLDSIKIQRSTSTRESLASIRNRVRGPSIIKMETSIKGHGLTAKSKEREC
jgi:hypothetical protein